MKPKNDRPQSAQSQVASPLSIKRFRIQKLEERIAPKKGGGTRHGCGQTTGSGSTY